MNERLEWGLSVFQESQLTLSIEGFEHGAACAVDEGTDAFTVIQGQAVTIHVHISPGANTAISNETFLAQWRKYLPSIGVDLQVYARQNQGSLPSGNPMSPTIMLRKSVSVEMVPCTDTATKAVFAERYDPETQTLSLAVTTAIQVKSHHLDQPLYLELALVVRTMHESDLHNEEYAWSAQDETEQLVRNIFQSSRVTPPKIPSKSARTTIRVVDPIKLTSSTHALHNEILINLQYENTHPQFAVKLVDAHFHLENTERIYRAAHQRTLSPARIQLSVLQAVDEHSRFEPGAHDAVIHYAALYDYVWVEKPINVVLHPGEVFCAAIKLRPKEFNSTARQGRLPSPVGELKTPLTTEWCLASSVTGACCATQFRPPVVSHTPPHKSDADNLTQQSLPPPPSLAAMHIVQWKAYERSHQELFIQIRGPQDVHAHEEFEVTASVTNTSSTPKVLWLLINVPMNAATIQLLKQQHQKRESEKGSLQLPALLEGGLVPHENMISLGVVDTMATVQTNLHLMPLRDGLATLQSVWLFDPNSSTAYEMQAVYSVFVHTPPSV